MKAVRRLVTVLAIVLFAWLGVNLLYTGWVRYSYAKWNAHIARTDSGVRVGHEAFSIGQGEVALLLVHGFADSPVLWRKIAPQLAQEGFAVRAMRLPGAALSMPEAEETSLAAWSGAFSDELAMLKREHERVWIVAHSMGAALAIRHLQEHPGDVEGLVLLAPLLAVSDERSPVVSPRTWFKMGCTLAQFTPFVENVVPLDARDPEVVATYPRDRFVPWSVYEGLFELLGKIHASDERPRVPLMMVLAEGDQVVDNAAAERFYRACTSVREGGIAKLLYKSPNTGHVITWDYGFDQLAGQIKAFIHAR